MAAKKKKATKKKAATAAAPSKPRKPRAKSGGAGIPRGHELVSSRSHFGRTLLITKSRKGYAAWVTGNTGKLIEVPVSDGARQYSSAVLSQAMMHLNELGPTGERLGVPLADPPLPRDPRFSPNRGAPLPGSGYETAGDFRARTGSREDLIEEHTVQGRRVGIFRYPNGRLSAWFLSKDGTNRLPISHPVTSDMQELLEHVNEWATNLNQRQPIQ